MKRFAGVLALLLAACEYETTNVYVECCEGCGVDAGSGPDSGSESPDADTPDSDLPDAGEPDAYEFVCPEGAICPCNVEEPWDVNACHDAGPPFPWDVDAGPEGSDAA